MKKLVIAIAILAGVAAVPDARAEIGTADAVPAATLLLPYFEVDLGDQNGVTTLISVNNASASAAVANVVLWTDWGVPSFGFNVYLTGYDVQTINLRDIFNGTLPLTADDGADPGDFPGPNGISNQGDLSQDINFPGSTGPCGSPATLYNAPDPTLAIKIQNIQQVHRGLGSPLDSRCWGANHGDAIARGYVTIDSVTQCTLDTPAGPTYFVGGVADSRNILWGDAIVVNPAENFAQGDTLVHVEACVPGNGFRGYVGDGAGRCPLVPGEYSFYGRYVGVLFSGADQREPLATTFAARYQGASKTDLLVWRDTKLPPSGANGPRTCGSAPAWFPLAQTDVVAFDNTENASDACAGGDACFPLATQRVNVKDGNALADRIKPPYTAGWLYLNLNHTVGGDPLPGLGQAWVSVVRSSEGRFSTGYQAVQLDNALDTQPGGTTLIP